MRGTASPVFTARISEFILDETQPPRATVLSGLELRLLLPDVYASAEEMMPLEYTLQGGSEDLYVYFNIKGIGDDNVAPRQLHRLCLLLLYVRDTLCNGLTDVVNLKPGN